MNITDFICGLLAGWTQVIVGQPFDFIKVKIQTAQKELPIFTITKNIRNQFGLKGFYRGSSSLFFGFAFVIGTEFLVYEWAKRYIFRNWGDRQNTNYNISQLKIWEIGLAGAFVGSTVSGIYAPVQYVKIQKQLNGNLLQSSLGLLFSEFKRTGIKNIFKGYWSTVVRQVWGSMLYYGSYECFVRMMTSGDRQKASTRDFLIAGGLAGFTFHLLTYPIDTIKTNIQAGQSFRYAARSAIQYSKLKGYKVVLTRAVLVNASSFLVYEKAQQYVTAINSYRYSMY